MNRENLIEQHKFLADSPFYPVDLKYDNFIIQASTPETKWIEDLTTKIADWRGIFRSAYIKWAITINGLSVANKRYEEKSADENFLFKVHSLRNVGADFEQKPIAEWNGEKAAQVHLDTIPMICTYGFVDLYNCLEEFVFDYYRTYWKHFPDKLLKGNEYRNLRDLNKRARLGGGEKEKWEKAFEERLDKWQRKKVYDNLGKVFLALCVELELKKPEKYITTPENWAESITGISIVRNTIVHGGKYVSKELGEFSKKPHSLGFEFKEGDELRITLFNLQSVELFLNQLLSALNLSLVEKYTRNDNQ